MERRTLLLWAPRLLLIAFALFLIIFSFDVLTAGKPPSEVALAFFIHNVPSLMLGLLVFAAWRREWIGASVCLLLAAAYVIWAWGRFPLSVYVVMVGPLVLVAMLYMLSWGLRGRDG